MVPSLFLSSLLSVALLQTIGHTVAPASRTAGRSGGVAEPPKPPDKGAPRAPEPAPPAPAVAPCKLITPEAPRGGRLEVEGEGFGKTPIVRIGGRVARTLERTPQRIAVQIAADSNGGPVTVAVDGKEIQCGVLLIIGRN
jgi:hypothetical protein